MSGEEAPGQERRCFPEILDLVFRLSDGAWRMLLYVANVTQVSQLQFAALSTHTIISAAKSVLQRCVPSLIGPAGMDIVLMEEGLLWKRVESESVSPAGPSTSADSTGPSSSTSAERSSVDQSDGTCDAVEDFLREVMEKSICKLTSSKASPLPGNWKTSSSPLTKEMLNLLEVSPSNSEEDLFAGLESREYLQTKTPKAVEEKIRELKEGADTSSETPESLVAQPVHIVTSRETTANHVSQRDDLAISCTNDVSGLHHQSAHRKVFQLHFDSCTDTVTRNVVEIHKSELLVSSSSKVSLLISIFLQKQPAVEVTTVKPQGFITSNTALSPTYRSSGEMKDPLALLMNSEQVKSERINDVGAGSAMLIRSPHRKVFQLHFDSFMDMVTRKVVEIHKSELLVSSSSKVSLLITVFLQKRPAVEVTTVKPQGFITSNTALNLTCRTSGEMEDPLALLVNSEQAESERINDVSVCDVTSPGASPPPSSKAGSETVRDTLENRSTSSQETSSSSSSPLDGREPEVVRKRSRGLRFFGGRKAPFISFGQKKSTKAGPAGVESTNHQADSGNHQSDSGNHQSDSGSQLSCAALQRESTAKPFRKARKRLSRMFSAVRKALPNPCSCMCPPS